MRSARSEKVIAVVCADLHLSLKPPIARQGESDWLSAQCWYYDQIRRLCDTHQVPVLCAGDVFHYWKAEPELINFALRYLPKMVAIPGQHDLPYHRLDLIEQSAYQTLVRANKITSIGPGFSYPSPDMWVYGFPWGVPVTPCERKGNHLKVALVHAYTWIDGAGYHGASDEQKLTSLDLYRGYDVVIIGDNHKSWERRTKRQVFFNCGGFVRRNSDETNHRPRVGLLTAGGDVRNHYLDTSKDVLLVGPRSDTPTTEGTLGGFLDRVKELDSKPLDFRERLKRAAESVESDSVRECLYEALETKT